MKNEEGERETEKEEGEKKRNVKFSLTKRRKKEDVSRKRSTSHLVLNPLIEFQLIHVGNDYSTFRRGGDPSINLIGGDLKSSITTDLNVEFFFPLPISSIFPLLFASWIKEIIPRDEVVAGIFVGR